LQAKELEKLQKLAALPSEQEALADRWEHAADGATTNIASNGFTC
jgi:hypothetical protein